MILKNHFETAPLRGDGGIRTLDLSDANRTLSQLSYAPSYVESPEMPVLMF